MFCGLYIRMPNWMSYAYCEKCDRPLRESEYRSETSRYGSNRKTRYYCKRCESRALMPWSILGLNRLYLIAWLMMVGSGIAVWNLQSEGDEFAEFDKFVAFFALPSAALLLFALGRWEQSKCKPIYDRWVMQYGLNHGDWPQLPLRKAPLEPAQAPARTTAQSLGRSLGRSLGWLLVNHPVVFWGLLIGAAVAIIYSGLTGFGE